jgi:hypothetical protein
MNCDSVVHGAQRLSVQGALADRAAPAFSSRFARLELCEKANAESTEARARRLPRRVGRGHRASPKREGRVDAYFCVSMRVTTSAPLSDWAWNCTLSPGLRFFSMSAWATRNTMVMGGMSRLAMASCLSVTLP